MLAGLVALLAGCFGHVEDHCRGCTVVEWTRPRLPAIAPSTHALVVLVHGGFGFGAEWEPVVAAVRARPGVELLVFWYHGVGRDPELVAGQLRALLQQAAAAAPSLREVVVLGHSFGGLLAGWAARYLDVPAGRRVVVHAIDPPRDMTILRASSERAPNTPLGLAVGAVDPRAPPSVPPRVEIAEYFAAHETRDPAAAGVRRVWLGPVGHDASVALVSLPVVARLPSPDAP